MSGRYRIGIDIGGTFSDILILDLEKLKISHKIKIETNPQSPEKPIINALAKVLPQLKDRVDKIFHATTIATNTLLGQMKLELPKACLITTKGFRDVLEIGRQRRPELYSLFVQKPPILIPRRYRFEVRERINYLGEIMEPLQEEDIHSIAHKILHENIISVAISLLHSYANPIHEKKIAEILTQYKRDLYISLSSEVDPEHREYERTSTTVVNAILMPIVSRYLRKLMQEVKSLGINSEILIMQSHGGVASVSHAEKFPVSIIESGPAAGVVATSYLGEALGINNLLSFDMGGTTAKAGTVLNGKPLITREYEVGGRIHAGRIIKGSGYPIRFPFIDLAEISAGGGSIAWIDPGGALRVGPMSAGADPGPACYGKGGENPTITDANLVLGRLNPKYLLGGEMPIHHENAIKALKEKVSSKLGLDLLEGAIGIIKIANNSMSKILRIVSVERGINPQELVLVAFGGAGPMHACALAQDLGIKEILIPVSPGLFSAFGLLVTDLKYTFIKSIRKLLDEVDENELTDVFKYLEEKGIETLLKAGMDFDKIRLFRFLEVRYWGQGYELSISLSPHTIDITQIEQKFINTHQSIYGYSIPDEPIEIVNARVEVLGLLEKPLLPRLKERKSGSVSDAIIEYRDVYFEDSDEVIQTPIYLREKLCAGDEIQGPAVIEQYDSTTILYPRWMLRVDIYGNLILSRE